MLTFAKQPYLQWPTQETMTVVWETSEPASSEVNVWDTARVHSGLDGRFRTLDDSARKITGHTPPDRIHRVTLTGLRPETTHHYRVRSVTATGETVESAVYPLKTAVNDDTPFSFGVTSEMGGSGTDAYNREVFEQMRMRRPDFLLLVGDAVNRGTHYDDWARYLFVPAEALLTHTPFYLVPGNHEENAEWFYRYVAYPDPKNYYAFRYGNTHFIGLDSTAIVVYDKSGPRLIERDGGFRPGAPQYEFLVNELASSTATWKIVFFHYPPYISADYQVDEMRALCPIMEAYGVDIVFNSHTIVYERSHPIRGDRLDLKNGITYVVAGGAGMRPQWFHHKKAWHTAFSLGTPHFLHVSVAGTRLELHAIDYEGRLFDMMVREK
ncbi:MAG: metallophosphoesterase family protein [candidate division Zixibacteria bacterium]|nr:metallophosphoesterase family protein [candidate division Zixibacteria bacterium]